MTLKDKLIVWVYHKTNKLESEKITLLEQRRYQAMDSLDLYENLRAEIRIDAWNEFISEFFQILLHCDNAKGKKP